MSLFEINIKEVVKSLTVEAILNSNYDNLKRSIIDEKPLAGIINSIDTYLAQLSSSEKETYSQKVTAQAYQKQATEDDAEQERDAQNALKDEALKKRLEPTIPQLTSELEAIENSLIEPEIAYNFLNNNLNILKKSKSDYEYQLDDIKRARKKITSFYDAPVSTTHVHGHGNAHGHSNMHEHGNTHVHMHQPVNPVIISAVDQAELNRLTTLETQLIASQQAISIQIQQLSYEVDTTYKKVDSIKGKIRDKKDALSNTQNQLDRIESNDIHRKKRKIDRDARHMARENKDLLQLSNYARQELDSDVHKQSAKIDNKRKELFDQANKLGNAVYVEQIELLTSQDNHQLQLPADRKMALSKILVYLKEYKKMQEQESTLKNEFSKLESILKREEQSLLYAKNRIQDLTQSIPQLRIDNVKISSTNQELESQAQTQGRWAGEYFAYSFFSGFATLITLDLFLEPTLFVLPGALALFAVGSLIAAIVYKIKEYFSYNEITTNKDKFLKNESKQGDQAREIKNLESIQIPQLNRDILNAKRDVDQKQSVLSTHNIAMANKKMQIENEGQVQVHQHGFFTTTMPNQGDPSTMQTSLSV